MSAGTKQTMECVFLLVCYCKCLVCGAQLIAECTSTSFQSEFLNAKPKLLSMNSLVDWNDMYVKNGAVQSVNIVQTFYMLSCEYHISICDMFFSYCLMECGCCLYWLMEICVWQQCCNWWMYIVLCHVYFFEQTIEFITECKTTEEWTVQILDFCDVPSMHVFSFSVLTFRNWFFLYFCFRKEPYVIPEKCIQ